MTFTFNTGIPAAGNNPSFDQPQMLQNNISTNAILGVDHVSFNAAHGGTHQQVTFSSENTPGAQTDPQSVLYTKAGAASTVAQLFYVNQNATFQISAIKAWGTFDVNGNPLGTNQKINIDSVTPGVTGTYVVAITTGALSSAFYGVLVTARRFDVPSSSDRPIFATYSIGNATSLTLFFWNPNGSVLVNPTYFTVQISQL